MEGDNRVDFYNKVIWCFDMDSQFQWHPFLMMVMEICLEVLYEMSYEVNYDSGCYVNLLWKALV